MAPMRPIPLRAALRNLPRSTGRNGHRWKGTGRRGYASEGGSSGESNTMKTLRSDMPWAIGAVAVTLPSCYFLLQNGHLGPIYNHPMPGDQWHEEEGGDKEDGEKDQADEGEEESEGGQEEAESSEGQEQEADQDQKAEQKERSGDDEDSDSGAANKESEKSSGDKSQATGGKDSNESSKASSNEADHKTKESASSDDYQAKKQKGLSNTDTKHAQDLSGMSVKGEGVPETAKVQGTIDRRRPQK